MANTIIQGLWVKGELSIMEQLSIKSFLANGHEYHLYVYDDVKNIPKGTLVKDGNSVLPSNMIFTCQTEWGKGSYAVFADLFRYYLLKLKGNWWVDTDVICLKPFNFESEYVLSSSFEGKWGEPACTCVMKMPKNSDLSKFLVNSCEDKNLSEIKYGEIGPHLLQGAVKKLNLENYVVSYEKFCPITWRAVDKIVYQKDKPNFKKTIKSVKDLIRPLIYPHTKIGKVTNNSYAIHLWNEIWRQNKLNKNERYHENCLYEQLKAKYL